jgi:hypothetical protein
MEYANKLKHMFRIYGNMTLWHLFVVQSFAAALAGYVATFVEAVHGWRLALYFIEGAGIGVLCMLVVACIDHFLFRTVYLHLKKQGHEKWCGRMMNMGIAFAFFWMIGAGVVGYRVGKLVAAHS